MRRFSRIVLSLLILISAADLWAAGDNTASGLSLDEAIQTAIDRSFSIRQAEEIKKSAVEEKNSARADLFAKAKAHYDYTGLKDQPVLKTELASIPAAHKDQYHWNVSLVQPLFTGFALSSRYRMSGIEVDIRNLEKEQAVQDLVRNVKSVYFQVLLAQKIFMVTEEAANALSAHAEDAKKFYDQGLIPYNDLLRSQVALADAAQEHERASAGLKMAVSTLNTLLNVDILADTQVEDIETVDFLASEFDTLAPRALEHRTELKALRLGLKNYDYAIRLARSTYFPEIALVGHYEQDGNNFKATRNDFSNSHNAAVSFQADWTFFEWGKTRAQVARIRHEKQALAEQLNTAEDAVRLEVRDALLNLKVSERNILTAEKSLFQAREDWRITNLQYQQQVATSTDVLDSRAYLTQADTNYYQALYGYMIALAELERALGSYPEPIAAGS